MECDLFSISIHNEEEDRLEDPMKLEAVPEHRNPFEQMHIANNDFLAHIEGRSPCSQCHKSRKFFCYTCYVPTEMVANLLPVVKVNC